jgi:hypothetical protein
MVQPSPLRLSPTGPTAIVTDIPAAEVAALTQDTVPEPVSETNESVLDVSPFLARHGEQHELLTALCTKWEGQIEAAADVSAEVADEIRSVVGQARLLLRKKMTKYLELCDTTVKEGRASGNDLEGYWDGCVRPQIDDVNTRFDSLDMCKRDGWSIAEDVQPTAPKKKKTRKTGPKKPPANKKAVGSRASTRDFLRKMRAQAKAGGRNTEEKPSEPVVQEISSTSSSAQLLGEEARTSTPARANPMQRRRSRSVVMTPIRVSRTEQESLGSAMVLMPVRRSCRQTPSKYKSSVVEQDLPSLLASTNHAYKPNPALNMMDSPVTRPPLNRSASIPTDGMSMQTDDDSPLGRLLEPETPLTTNYSHSGRSSTGPLSRSLPSTPLCGTSRVEGIPALAPPSLEQPSLAQLLAEDYPMLSNPGTLLPSPSPPAAADQSIDLITFTPAPKSMRRPQPTGGSVLRYATMTPSRGMR